MKKLIRWLKEPFYSTDNPDKLDGVLIAAVALMIIILIIFWKVLMT